MDLGTVFFSNCNMKCKFCQNYKISHEGKGNVVTIKELSDIFLKLQNQGANNINLVTPTIYVYQIINAIKLAKKNGLKIPIIYNTNGYEKVETIKQLNGLIDVYLPDLKYYDNNIAKEYSNVTDYFECATKAINEMYNQVGYPEFDDEGIIKHGLIIRHLVLPNNINDSKKILKWIKDNIDSRVYISVMAQYFPCYQAKLIKNLDRKLNQNEYNEIKDYIDLLEIENGYIQELGEHEEEYVPNF